MITAVMVFLSSSIYFVSFRKGHDNQSRVAAAFPGNFMAIDKAVLKRQVQQESVS
jgi:hypothetical protein